MTSAEDESGYARKIVEGFLEGDGRAVEIEGALVVSDVEEDAAEFLEDLSFLRRIGQEVPAVQIQEEELIPIALSVAVPGLPLFRPGPRAYELYEWYHYSFRQYVEKRRESPGFSTISHEQA